MKTNKLIFFTWLLALLLPGILPAQNSATGPLSNRVFVDLLRLPSGSLWLGYERQFCKNHLALLAEGGISFMESEIVYINQPSGLEWGFALQGRYIPRHFSIPDAKFEFNPFAFAGASAESFTGNIYVYDANLNEVYFAPGTRGGITAELGLGLEMVFSRRFSFDVYAGPQLNHYPGLRLGNGIDIPYYRYTGLQMMAGCNAGFRF